MKEALIDSHKYRLWQQRLRENGMQIQHTEEIYTRYNHKGDALFALVMLNAMTPEGEKIPPICFIKGEVVCLLVCLIDAATGEKYLLLVRQRRICNGGLIYEHVAGMVDHDEAPIDVAIREAEEEAHLILTRDQVFALNEVPFYPSTGTSDEAMYFFYTELTLPYEKIRAMGGRNTGAVDENEQITTLICPLAEAKRLITNTNGLLHIYLYQEAVAS